MNLITKPLFGIALNAVVLYLLTMAVTEITYTGGYKFFIIGGLFLGSINLVLKPVIKLLSLPVVVITGGLFLIIINIGVLWLLKYSVSVIQFQDVTLSFPNWAAYVIGAVVFGIINWIAHLLT